MGLPADKLHNWPRRMKADLAAEYCGVSSTKFRSEVAVGRLPAGILDGGNRLWYREDLDSALDRLKQGGEPSGDPEEEVNEWLKAVREG